MLMNYYRNIDRELVQFDFLTHRYSKGAYDDEILRLGGRIYNLPRLNPFDIKYHRELDLFFSKNNYDIVHSHLDTMSAFPLKYAKKYGVPIRIAHSHTTNIDKNMKYFIKLLCKKLIPKFATDFFSCSQQAGKWMFKNNKFVVINNGIQVENYQYSPDVSISLRKELGIEGKYVIGHVGRLSKPKNHTFLIDFFYEFNRIMDSSILLLVGTGELDEIIKKKVEKLGLSQKVIFLGLRDDVHHLLSAMDLFVFPSLYEGLGVALIEAQANGIPCLISKQIPEEVIIAPNVITKKLEDGPKEWASLLNETIDSLARISSQPEVIRSGFDIKANAIWLEGYYLNAAKRSATTWKT